MSTKKDKFTDKDLFYMEIALDLARSRHGLTGSNPSVGCVIVKNDKIISIGQTSFNGRPHAEYNAIKNSFEDLKGSKKQLWKLTRKDSKKGKSTLINLLGYKKAYNYAIMLKKKILLKLKKHGKKAKELINTIEFILERKF